ncbi:MAG: hypothetical protein EAZ67_13950 [Cytophagales bacterium]|nr:MAG: hypothetical protein EAZ67_13950 [Cytophagales bacterium]
MEIPLFYSTIALKINLFIIFYVFSQYAFSQKTIEETQISQLQIELKTAPISKIIVLENQKANLLNALNLLDSSLNVSEQNLILAQNMQNRAEITKAEINIAIILQKKGRYFESTNFYESALKNAPSDSLLAIAYHFLGTCYKDQNQLEKCVELTQKSLFIAQKNNYKSIWAKNLNTIGLTIFRTHKYYDKALKIFHEALNVANQTDDENIKSVINKNIGWVHLLWEEEAEGLAYVNKAIEMQTKSNKAEVRQNLFYSYMVLIHFYNLVKKDFQSSILYCQKAIELAEKYHWVEEKAEVYHYFYLNYKALKNPQKALEYHVKYQETTAKLNEDKIVTQKAIIEEKSKNNLLEFEYKQEVNQRNWLIFSLFIATSLISIILFLNKKLRKQKGVIEEINQNLEHKVIERTADLQKALDEIKEAMLKGQTLERKRVAAELHDNLGSLLSAVSISLDVVDVSHLSKQEQFIFQNVQNQIIDAYREVRLLSHNLQPAELEKEGLEKAITRLAEKINLTGKLKMHLNLTEIKPLSKEIEFNLYSICLEAINNILKHSEATKCEILFKQSDSQLIMEIADNGLGFENNIKNGFGINNIQSRVEQLGGKLEINSNEKGTVLAITII